MPGPVFGAKDISSEFIPDRPVAGPSQPVPAMPTARIFGQDDIGDEAPDLPDFPFDPPVTPQQQAPANRILQSLSQASLGFPTMGGDPRKLADAQTDLAQATLGGFTFGYSDEGIAYADSVITGADYDEKLAKLRSNMDAMPPAARMLAEGAGHVARELSPLGLAGRAVKTGSTLAKTGKLAAVSGVEGALTGFGQGRGTPDRLEKAATGGAIGTTIGAAIPPIARGGELALRPFARLFKGSEGAPKPVSQGMIRPGRDAQGRPIKREPINPESSQKIVDELMARYDLNPAEASSVVNTVETVQAADGPSAAALAGILNALERDAVTPQMASAKILRLGERGVLADLGPNLQGLAETVALFPGKAKRLAMRVLTSRNVSQGDQIEASVNIAFGGGNFVRTEAQILADRAAKSGPLYEAARGYGVLQSPALREWVAKSTDVLAAIKRTKRQAQFADLDDFDMRVLDQAYKDLGGKANKAFRSGDGNKYHVLGEQQGEFRRLIGQEVPVYLRALEEFSGHSALRDALVAGRQFLREDAEATAQTVQNMPAGERQMFMIGVARGIKDIVGATADTSNATRRIFGNRVVRDKIRSVLPDMRAFRKFQATVLRANREQQTYNAVVPGSQTARRLTGAADLGILSDAEARGLGHSSTMNLTVLAGRIFKKITEPLTRAPERTRDEIARLLLTQGVEANQAIIAQLARAKSASEVRQLVEKAATGSALE